MKTIFALLATCSALTGHAAEINLLCTGNLEETQVSGKTKTTPIRLDVRVQADKGLVGIDGYWGCTLDMASMGQPNREMICGRALPVDVNESELHFHESINGPLYSGTTNYVINRYTGTMTISNYAEAKPDAKANWVAVMFSAKLECTTPPKLF